MENKVKRAQKKTNFEISAADALIIVDLQNDYCPGGTVAVPGGDEIVKPLNRILPLFPFVVTSQCWHPPDHVSFETEGGSWPTHCVQNTHGAELHSELNQKEIDLKIRKGQFKEKDAYSAFQGTTLEKDLKVRQVERVFVVGLALDHSMKHTAIDAIRHGFKVVVITDLTRGMNVNPLDSDRAFQDLRNAGALLITSQSL